MAKHRLLEELGTALYRGLASGVGQPHDSQELCPFARKHGVVWPQS
jgi:hypothetical protein